MVRSEIDQSTAATMTIRRVGDADRADVELLAQRDSARIPDGPLIGIDVDGSLVAVTSLEDGHTVADPFRCTEEPRAMLELRAAQLQRRNGRARGSRLRLPRRARAALAGSPPGAGGRLLTLRR